MSKWDDQYKHSSGFRNALDEDAKFTVYDQNYSVKMFIKKPEDKTAERFVLALERKNGEPFPTHFVPPVLRQVRELMKDEDKGLVSSVSQLSVGINGGQPMTDDEAHGLFIGLQNDQAAMGENERKVWTLACSDAVTNTMLSKIYEELKTVGQGPVVFETLQYVKYIGKPADDDKTKFNELYLVKDMSKWDDQYKHSSGYRNVLGEDAKVAHGDQNYSVRMLMKKPEDDTAESFLLALERKNGEPFPTHFVPDFLRQVRELMKDEDKGLVSSVSQLSVGINGGQSMTDDEAHGLIIGLQNDQRAMAENERKVWTLACSNLSEPEGHGLLSRIYEELKTSFMVSVNIWPCDSESSVVAYFSCPPSIWPVTEASGGHMIKGYRTWNYDGFHYALFRDADQKKLVELLRDERCELRVEVDYKEDDFHTATWFIPVGTEDTTYRSFNLKQMETNKTFLYTLQPKQP
eukprot:GHVS01095963.1.p1 GENE.GHVS01095963.1~~GHVS01095963.1.p1  ORF type:complete len:462 (+),score=50.42 GHVS01095963.1:106-1491(+)